MSNVLEEKSIDYAIRIIKLSELLSKSHIYVISDQVLRSGTSIGANIAESIFASSKQDFVNKLQISQKEASETRYWLGLIKKMGYVDEKLCDSLISDVEEIIKILSKSITTTKSQIET